MKHYIVTNRPVVFNNGKEQIDTGNKALTTSSLRFGTYDTQSKKVELFPDLPMENNKYLKVNYSIVSSDKKLFGSAKWFKSLYDEMSTGKKNNDTLFFIHGFNCGYDCLIENIEELHGFFVKDDKCSIARIVAFTWPSNDSLTDYFDDQVDAKYSGAALARGYHKLIKFFNQFLTSSDKACNNNIHLLCHSMGNQVFESMVKSVTDSRFPVTPVFKEIILAAPDINNSALEPDQPLNRITDFGTRVHVYYNNSDDALKISEKTKNKEHRLGLNGPANSWNVKMNVNFVDTSDIKDAQGAKEKLFNHWYYKKSATVRNDIRQILNGVHTEHITNREFINHKNVFRLK